MSDTRPLRLQSETAKRVERIAADSKPVAKVWVDNSISHLDGVYDYLVPARLDEQVKAGVRVVVDFAGRDCEAMVLERVDSEATSGLKFLSKVLSPIVVAPTGLLRLIEIACQRWLAHPYDFLRSAIPPRAAVVDKDFSDLAAANRLEIARKGHTTFIHVQPHEEAVAKLATFALEKSKSGSILIITPEERELQVLAQTLGDKANLLSASLSRTDRYRNYLRSINEKNLITIGTRSAIFAYPPDLHSIIVFREGAQSHYEPRSPGWNTREIAFLRAKESGCDLFFVGYCPSLS